MKEYKSHLIKKINEIYYRNFTNSKFHLITNKITYKELEELMPIALELDTNLLEMICDLYEITRGNTNFIPISKYLTELLDELKSFNEKFDLSSIKDIIDILKVSDNSYLVGGCVRDTILGLIPKDYDFVTDISYDELEKIFVKNEFKIKEAGKQFLVMIVSKNGKNYEIANFRKEGTYLDGRRPESVSIGDIYDDAYRRDFTINALYYNITKNVLKDPTGQGINDIKTKTLRFIGNPVDRLQEDYLRAWRLFRFAKEKEFNIETKTLRTIRSMWEDIYKKSNPERVLNEIQKFRQ